MAAITVTCPPGQYEKTMREARQKINLEGLGIKGVKIRRAITGALMYEIPGENSSELADKLACKLRQTLIGKEGVKVQRPTKTAEIRVKGLDETVTPAEIRETIAREGECEEEEIAIGEVKMSPSGIGTVWARCPVKAANIAARKGQIQIGWALTRVELLEDRPLQCYKCLEGGHVRARCPNKIDRSGNCYRCGQEGHQAKNCVAPVHCSVCSDRNLPSNHRTGRKACTPVQKGKRGIPLAVIIGQGKAGSQQKEERMEVEAELRETEEKPKEQRPQRTREKKKGAEGEDPLPHGGNKRQRLKRECKEGDPAAMEIAVGDKDDAKN